MKPGSAAKAPAYYVAIRDLIREGNEDPAHPKVAEACSKFIQDFSAQVMAPDISIYYGPVLKQLLGQAGVPTSHSSSFGLRLRCSWDFPGATELLT